MGRGTPVTAPLTGRHNREHVCTIPGLARKSACGRHESSEVGLSLPTVLVWASCSRIARRVSDVVVALRETKSMFRSSFLRSSGARSRRSQHVAQSDHGGARSVFHCLRSAPARIALEPAYFVLARRRKSMSARSSSARRRAIRGDFIVLAAWASRAADSTSSSLAEEEHLRSLLLVRRAICRRFIAR